MLNTTAPSLSTLPQVGTQFGPYAIESFLGEGGVAKVYRSRGENGCSVALKVLKQEAAQYAEVRMSFDREYTLASRLSHSSIVGALDSGQIDGQTYLTMPAIEGGSLDTWIPGGKRLPVDRAVSVARQIAMALHHVHANGIVHRDVKPGNILLDGHKNARLCDFGLAIDEAEAQVNADGRLYGTPLYVAPEQTQPGAKLDGRADLYSLGVVLYRMVTGRAPFYGSRGEVLDAHRAATPPCPSKFVRLSPALEALLLKALAKDPAQRFQSGAEFATALANCDLCVQKRILPRILWPFCCPGQLMQAS